MGSSSFPCWIGGSADGIAPVPSLSIAVRLQLSEARIPAIDRDRRAGDEIGRGARQEHGDTGEVLGLAPAADGRARQHALVQAGYLLARVARQVGVDPAR